MERPDKHNACRACQANLLRTAECRIAWSVCLARTRTTLQPRLAYHAMAGIQLTINGAKRLVPCATQGTIPHPGIRFVARALQVLLLVFLDKQIALLVFQATQQTTK